MEPENNEKTNIAATTQKIIQTTKALPTSTALYLLQLKIWTGIPIKKAPTTKKKNPTIAALSPKPR
jgi:hypothetical protein